MDWGAETSGGRGGVEPRTGLIERWTDGEYEREGKNTEGRWKFKENRGCREGLRNTGGTVQW